jgi:hypothetical protein
VELARLHPGLNISLAVQDYGMVDLMRREIRGARLDREIALRCSELDNLVFADSVFA